MAASDDEYGVALLEVEWVQITSWGMHGPGRVNGSGHARHVTGHAVTVGAGSWDVDVQPRQIAVLGS